MPGLSINENESNTGVAGFSPNRLSTSRPEASWKMSRERYIQRLANITVRLAFNLYRDTTPFEHKRVYTKVPETEKARAVAMWESATKQERTEARKIARQIEKLGVIDDRI